MGLYTEAKYTFKLFTKRSVSQADKQSVLVFLALLGNRGQKFNISVKCIRIQDFYFTDNLTGNTNKEISSKDYGSHLYFLFFLFPIVYWPALQSI